MSKEEKIKTFYPSTLGGPTQRGVISEKNKPEKTTQLLDVEEREF